MNYTPTSHSEGQSLISRLLLIAVCLCSIVALMGFIALRRFHLPVPTGPYPVGTAIFNMTDATRHEDGSTDPAARRSLVVQIWYPASPSKNPIAAYQRWRETSLTTSYESLLQTHSRLNAPVAADGAFPVLLFGHRWGGQRTQNTDLAEELASRGYVVAAIDHPYNSSRVLLGDGRVIRGTQQLEGPKGAAASAEEQIAFWNSTLEVWAADDLFVLNQLAMRNGDPRDPLHSRLDTDHAGAFGHSFGGAVSLRLCGLDPRIKAAVNLDGWSFGALTTRSAAQPVMMEYEQVSVNRRRELLTAPFPGTTQDQLDRADNAAVDASLARYGGYRLYVAGTQHLDFTDQPLLPPLRRTSFTGPIPPLQVQAILRATVVGFFDQSLRAQPSPLLSPKQQRFGELSVESTSALQ